MLHDRKPIVELCRSASLWDQYVSASSAGTPFHLHGWQHVIKKSYQHPTYFLNALTQDVGGSRICGILPLVHFDYRDGESRLISLPFLDCSGVLADSPLVEQCLCAAALKLAEKIGAAHLELRQDSPSLFQEQEFQSNERYTHQVHTFKLGFRRSLPYSVEELWKSLKPKVRNQVRKARKSDCQSKVGKLELLHSFYTVFSENMRDLGSPVHALSFFKNILQEFQDRVTIVLIERHGTPIAGSMVINMQGTMHNPWASSLRGFRPLCPNMLLYHRMLTLACEQNCRFFDFGRSSADSSAHRFKKQWGAKPRPLAWHIFSRKPATWIPERESLVILPWKELDLDCSRRTGPKLRRWISL